MNRISMRGIFRLAPDYVALQDHFADSFVVKGRGVVMHHPSAAFVHTFSCGVITVSETQARDDRPPPQIAIASYEAIHHLAACIRRGIAAAEAPQISPI
jgi:hypothetical protein